MTQYEEEKIIDMARAMSEEEALIFLHVFINERGLSIIPDKLSIMNSNENRK